MDPCHPTYRLDPQSLQDGKLKWQQQEFRKLDYELQSLGYFKATQFLNFKDASEGKFYLPVPMEEDPPENPSDSRMGKFNMQDL